MVKSDQIEPLLRDRRWFGGKGREFRSVDIVDQVEIADGDPSLQLVIVKVTFGDGDEHLYHLPLVHTGDSFVDAFDDLDRLKSLGELMSHGASFGGERGTFHFGGPGLDPLSPPGHTISPVTAEQTNTSLILDDDIIVKVFRRVQIGANPDLEINRFLTNEGYENIPPHVGEIIYRADGDEERDEATIAIDLGIAQKFLKDSEEGWRYVLRELHDLLDAIEPEDAEEEIDQIVADRANRILLRIEELGDVVATLHVSLAREDIVTPFSPEQIDSAEAKEMAESVRASLRKLFDAGERELAAFVPKIDERLDLFMGLDDLGQKARIHNDLHLGQVLLSGRGWMLLDFEGEPARTLEERRAKHSPLKDVAGMLRSFSYAATAVLFERTEPDGEEWSRLRRWVDAWEALARERFLSGYLASAHTQGRFLPEGRDDVEIMLDAYEIDKAVYELSYERAHRPDWARIPRRGIARLVDGGAR